MIQRKNLELYKEIKKTKMVPIWVNIKVFFSPLLFKSIQKIIKCLKESHNICTSGLHDNNSKAGSKGMKLYCLLVTSDFCRNK